MDELDQLLAALTTSLRIADAEQYGAERYGAPRFSMLDIVDTKETALSRILAHLLDPTGTHGQGTLFLNSFLEAVGLPIRPLAERIVVRREALTDAGRRIDVVLESPSLVVGIENKPYAGEGDNQLADYLVHLRSVASGRAVRLVFLSNKPPSIQDADLVHIAFSTQHTLPSLTRALQTALLRVKAPRVRAFVKDLAEWIERQFGEQSKMGDDMPFHVAAVMEQARASAANRKAIGAVLLAQDEMHRSVLDEIGALVLASVRKNSPDAELTDTRPLSRVLAEAYVSWGIRRPSWPSNCFLAIEAERDSARGIGYGVVALDPDSKEAAANRSWISSRIAEITQLVQTIPGSERPADWWRWSRYARSRDWSAAYCARLLVESEGGVGQHPDVVELVSEMAALADAVNQLPSA